MAVRPGVTLDRGSLAVRPGVTLDPGSLAVRPGVTLSSGFVPDPVAPPLASRCKSRGSRERRERERRKKEEEREEEPAAATETYPQARGDPVPPWASLGPPSTRRSPGLVSIIQPGCRWEYSSGTSRVGRALGGLSTRCLGEDQEPPDLSL